MQDKRIDLLVLFSEHHKGEICKHMEPTVDPTHTSWCEKKSQHLQKNRSVLHGNVSQELFLKSWLTALPLLSPIVCTQRGQEEAAKRIAKLVVSAILHPHWMLFPSRDLMSCYCVVWRERITFLQNRNDGEEVAILKVTMWPSGRMLSLLPTPEAQS